MRIVIIRCVVISAEWHVVRPQRSFFRHLFSGLQSTSLTLSAPFWVCYLTVIVLIVLWSYLEDLPPLTQRQERRVVNHITSINSVESWDFPTINSSFPTIHRKRFSETLFSPDDRANLNISLLTESSDPDLLPSEQAKQEIDVLSSSGTSSGNSRSVFSSITTPSTTTSLLHTSPSYTESTRLPYAVQEKLSSESRPPLELLASRTENANQSIPVSSELSLPAASPCTSSSQQFTSTTPIAWTGQQGLWRKIKINVRTSSRTDDEGLDNSPRKARRKISGIFASASKGLLSSRSLGNAILTPSVFNRCADLFFSSCQINISLFTYDVCLLTYSLIFHSTFIYHMSSYYFMRR